jgi:predicted phosphodiesterase
MRVFALSDVHVDYQANMAWLQALSPTHYGDDTLILAGDVSDDLDKLRAALTRVRATFAEVFFVPGNHELWVRRGNGADSMAKFRQILELCAALGVRTRPARVGAGGESQGVWIVPLFSWYIQPEEGEGSLFVEKPGEDRTREMWVDNALTRWPSLAPDRTVAEAFLHLNEPHLARQYDTPVLSFSHFLPRLELIFRTQEEREAAGITLRDAHPWFNFSRVAGCTGLETQIRRLGSRVHVYGHQHRNRYRMIDGVLYISHCLAYPHERARGYVHHVESSPRLIWDTLAHDTRCS